MEKVREKELTCMLNLKKDVFVCHECGGMRNQTSYLQILCSDALPLNHRDTTVSEVYYKVHMTCFVQTAGISNVHSIVFVNWIREMVGLELGKEIKMFFIYYEHRIKKNSESSNYFFFVPHTIATNKKHLSPFL